MTRHDPDARITLTAGPMSLTLAPGLGGAVAALRHDVDDLLRPLPENGQSALDSGCFPLVPYANRIADGRIAFGARAAVLPPNLEGERHPLHGDGWLSPWQVEQADATHAVLSLAAGGGPWPWSYVARQSFTLAPDRLGVRLSVQNTDTAAGLFGLGLHPYFPARATARLTARLDGVWLTGAGRLPERHVGDLPFGDWPAGAPLDAGREIDNCHTGWDGHALIDLGPDRPGLSLAAGPQVGDLHIYSPDGGDSFCLEPVTHRPNDLPGLTRLEPGATMAIEVELTVIPTAP